MRWLEHRKSHMRAWVFLQHVAAPPACHDPSGSHDLSHHVHVVQPFMLLVIKQCVLAVAAHTLLLQPWASEIQCAWHGAAVCTLCLHSVTQTT